MKTLRRICATFMMTMVLTLAAYAGEMTTGIATTPPDSQTATTGDMSTSVTGDMTTGVTAVDPVTGVVLNLLESLPPLF